MRGEIPGALPIILAMTLAACAAAPPAPLAADEGLPLVVPAPAPPTAAAAAQPEGDALAPPDPGEEPAPCPFVWAPRDLGASVVVIPAELASRMMTPLYQAACACTRPGQRVYLVAQMIPERGEISARTAEREDLQIQASPRVDACLAAQLGGQRHEPFQVGSDVICSPEPAPEAPRQPGRPAPFRPPRPACAGRGEGVTRINYPLLVDRRGEARP